MRVDFHHGLHIATLRILFVAVTFASKLPRMGAREG